MINEFKYQDDLIEADTELTGNRYEVTIGSNKYLLTPLGAGKFLVEANGVKKKVCCAISDGTAYADIDGILIDLTIPSEDDEVAGGAEGAGGVKDKIFAPMPGKIVKILVEEGQEIEEKQPMVIVEAMKMENQVNAAAAGTVKKINFKDGDQVDTVTPIIELDIEE